jgi:hypothetical protein
LSDDIASKCLSQEPHQLEQLHVVVVVIPALDGDAVLDLVAVGVRRVLYQHHTVL